MVKNILKKKDIIIFIIINILIFISYFILISKLGFRGQDDYLAVTSEFNPDITFEEKLNQIYEMAKYWNARIGNIICLAIGELPSNLIFFITTSIMVFLINIISYFAIGKVGYDNKIRASISNLIIYILFFTVHTFTTEVFFWYTSFYSHCVSVLLLLIVLLPFRNILDGKDNLKKCNVKYIFYILLCLIVGFNNESVVLTSIFAMFIYNVYYIIKNKKISIIKILPLIALCISFFIFMYMSQIRVNFFINDEYVVKQFGDRITKFCENRLMQILSLIVFVGIYFIVYKLEDIKNFKIPVIMLIISSISIIIMFIAPYYSNRRSNDV